MTTRRHDAPPRLACRLLAAILPADVAGRSTLGDLIEEYYRRPRGLWRYFWFWLVSLEVVAQYLPQRVTGLGEAVWRDLVYAARLARKYPGLVGAAIVSLSLAIGICTAGFSIANSAWLRPNLAADASIVKIWRRHGNGASLGWPRIELRQIRERAQRVAIEAISTVPEHVGSTTGTAEQDMTTVGFVSGGYFAMLGERAFAGRLVEHADDQPGASPMVVLDHLYWRRHFGGDRQVLGQHLTIRGVEFTIAGIAGRDFIDPTRRRPAMWATLASLDTLPGTIAGSIQPFAIGRLGPGASVQDVNHELTGLLTSIAPTPNVPRAVAFEAFAAIPPEETAAFRTILLSTFGVIALVLVLASTNVSNLQLAGAAFRRQEIAVRLSCGAHRGRIVRQFVTESALVSVTSCVLGLLLARWLAPVLAAGMNMVDADVDPDLRVYAFAAGAAVLCVALTALAPAHYGSRRDISTALTAGPGDRLAASRGRARSLFVGVQAAASLVLVTLAALQVRTLVHLVSMDPGVDVSELLAVSADSPRRPQEIERANAFWPRAVERVRQLPGVERASLAAFAPFNVTLGNPFDVRANATDADYFATTGLRVIRGRTYTAEEAAGPHKVAVISELLARRFWRDEDPIGTTAGRVDSLWAGFQIIGIVEDAFIDRVDARRPPTIYLPYTGDGFAQVVVRTRNPAAISGAITAALNDVSPDMKVRTTIIEDRYLRQLERPRRYAALAACVAVFALVLAVVGLFGVTSFTVRTRVREIGIRIALGARRSEVGGLLVRDAIRPVIVGLVVGFGVSLLAGRAMTGVLYGMSARDPAALSGAVLILSLAALVAVIVPTRRAARLDPAVILRDS